MPYGGGGSSGGGSQTPEQIRDNLQALTGSNRLSATAIKDLPSSLVGTFEKKLDSLAAANGIANGGSFTTAMTEELFTSALGTDVTVRTTNGRVAGTYGQGAPSSLWCTGGNPPTGNGAFLEVIIPANVLVGMDLVLTRRRASSTGTRGEWLYDGNPTAGGTHILPVLGSRINTTAEDRTVVYDLDGLTGDLHLVFSRVLLSDVQLIPSSIRKNSLIGTGVYSEAFNELADQAGLAHGAVLTEAQTNQCLEGLGIGATLRTDAGRELPRLFSTGVGRGVFAHVDNQDETTTNARVVEYVIPRRNLSHATSFDLGFLQVSTGGTDRSVSVYYGDPTTGGTKAVPVRGTESHGAYERVVYNASTTPDALGELPHDIHIVIKRACLITFHMFYNDATNAKETSITEVRGGERPAEFSTTSNYTTGDSVYRSSVNRTYQAVRNVTAGAWNPSDWQEESLLGHAGEIRTLQQRTNNHNREITALRGDNAYPSFSNTADYAEGTKIHYNSRNYRAKVAVTAGNFDASEWDEMSISSCTLAENVRDRLQTLTGAERLDASAIKGLPSGGGHSQFTGTVNSNKRWFDLYTWEGSSSVNQYSDFIILNALNAAGESLFQASINVLGNRKDRDNESSHVMRVFDRVSTYPMQVNAEYRVIFDTDADDSKVRLQFRVDLDEDLTITIVDNSPVPPSADETLGDLAVWTGSGEKVVSTMNVTEWQAEGVSEGVSGGIVADNIGDATVKQAWTRYSNRVVEQLAGNQVVQHISESGTRFSAGRYGTWSVDSSNDPFVLDTFSSITATGRTDPDDSSLNPFGNVVLSGADTSTGSGNINFTNHSVGGQTRKALSWQTLDGTSQLKLTFNDAGVTARTRLRFRARFHSYSDLNDAPETFEVRVGSPTGTLLTSWAIAAASEEYLDFQVEHDVTVAEALANQVDLYLVQTAGPAQVTTRSGLFTYGFDVISVEPDLQTNVVAQFDSNDQSVLLPRIAPVTSVQHTQGAMALNALDNNHPIFWNGNDWSNLALISNDTASVDKGAYYDSTFGDGGLSSQGFEQTTGDAMVLVNDYQGFPRLLKSAGTNILSVFSTIDDTDEFWQAAWDRGLIVTHRVIAADTTAPLHMNIEPRNTSTSWGAGRFTYNVTNDSSGNSVLQLERANGGSGSLEVPFSRDVMHTINVVVPSSSNTAVVVLDGQAVGTISLGGFDGQRGICTFIMDSSSREYYIQQYGISVMAATAVDKTFTVKEIQDAIRYVIPTTANDFTLTMPKEVFEVGRTFTIVNGGSREVTIKGADDDVQLFAGNVEGKIPAGHECTFVQTGFPRGAVWSMSTATTKRTTVSQGHSLHLRCTAAGSIISQHGTYTGTVNIVKTTTGHYDIDAIDHTFTSSNFVGQVTPWSAVDEDSTGRLGITGLGLPQVETRVAGALADAAFSVSLYW